jgi:hypothetical protein
MSLITIGQPLKNIEPINATTPRAQLLLWKLSIKKKFNAFSLSGRFEKTLC